MNLILFDSALVGYLLATVLALVHLVQRQEAIYRLAVLATLAGWVLHTLGPVGGGGGGGPPPPSGPSGSIASRSSAPSSFPGWRSPPSRARGCLPASATSPRPSGTRGSRCT